MGTGIQDAVNLGWKLAQVVRGVTPDSLLDTYHDERHPVAARVLQNTRAAVALGIQDGLHEALRGIVGNLLELDDARRQIAAMLFALDLRYDVLPGGLADAHPLVGRRMPDVDLHVDVGPAVGGARPPARVYELLHRARPVLLHLDAAAPGPDLAPWATRVDAVVASAAPTCEVPLVGTVGVPPAVLIRPDGHVAWAGDPGDAELPAALTRWFGPAAG